MEHYHDYDNLRLRHTAIAVVITSTLALRLVKTATAEHCVRDLSDALLLIQTTETGLQQNDENLRIMKERFSLSLSTLSDLLDAQSQWLQAESNFIETKTQYKISEAEYLRAIGQLE